MMPAVPSSEFERALTPPPPSERPSLEAIPAEYFLRAVVAGIGVGIGLIAAVIIGFLTGWIVFNC
jgi:hypothetical protein